MFEKNILTFNPGWDSSARKLGSFTDIRDGPARLNCRTSGHAARRVVRSPGAEGAGNPKEQAMSKFAKISGALALGIALTVTAFGQIRLVEAIRAK